MHQCGPALDFAGTLAENDIVRHKASLSSDCAAQLVARLQRQRLPAAPPRPPAEIVAEARRQAALLRDVPRAEIAARFEALTEEIRGQAGAQGTAIEGDWRDD